MSKQFSDDVIQRFKKSDPKVLCRTITFQVTNDCCLRCSYCYQTHKGHAMMSVETGKQIVDLLFKLYDEDKEDSIINHHTKGIVLDFIGGEPFMNVKTIDAILEYFIYQCAQKDHIWLTNFRISMSSNGILYFKPEVQKFLDRYQNFLSLNITIDGPKEVHDLCRLDYDNNGSFDRAIAAWDDWFNRVNANSISTKITIAPENLPHLENIFDFFFKRGCKDIHANPIFEHNWTPEEASLYYKILIKLADRLLDEPKAESSLFTTHIGYPLFTTDTNNWCGGTAAMLAFDPEGNAYPCLRYMADSLGSTVPPIIIGNVNGIYNTPESMAIYQDMKAVTRQSQSTQECLDCPVASGCAWCSAANYLITGSYNKRLTYICWMHRARSLANSYYWNWYYRIHEIKKNYPLYLPRDIARQIISDEEYDKLLELALY